LDANRRVAPPGALRLLWRIVLPQGGKNTSRNKAVAVLRFRHTSEAHSLRTSGWRISVAPAHFSGTKVAAAYQRGDLLLKRRRLMERWGIFCCPTDAEVIQLPA
jgi:hypothetical protein